MILKNYTILYVEDDESVLQMVSEILQDLVKELYIARDGVEGLIKYKQYKPDIVISDLVMPNMDGQHMAKEIKHLNPNQPIALLTAYDNPEYLKQAAEIGIDKYIIKPITDMDAFIGTIISLATDLMHHEKEQFFEKVYSHSKQGIMITDEHGIIVDVNRAFTDISGYSKEESIGKTPAILKSGKYDENFYAQMWQDLQEKGY